MRSFTLAVIAGLFLIAAGSAQGAPSVTGTFDLPQAPQRAALGPDGNMWVTLGSTTPNLARVAPDGTVTPFTAVDQGATNLNSPLGIVAGPDGNMWVTGGTYVAKFSTTNPTSAIKTDVAGLTQANEITVGPDGKLWTGSGDKIYSFAPADAPTVTANPTGIANFTSKGLTAGGDGRIWIANGDGGNPGILPMTTAGTPGTQLNTIEGQVQGVAAGPNNQIAYTNPVAAPQRIGLINAGVLATPFQFPVGPDATGIVLGQDDAYWMGQFNAPSIGRFTTNGEYSTIPGVPVGGRRIAVGPNGTLWVTFELTNKIVRVSGVENPDTTPPVYSKVSVTNKIFKLGSKKTALAAKAKKKKTPTGTTLKYTLSEAITAGIDVHKAVPGRTKGKNCVKPTAKLKKAKKCTRYVVVGSFTRAAKAGANTFAFSGRYGKTKLKPGKYRFLLYGKDAKGNNATPKSAKFAVVAK